MPATARLFIASVGNPGALSDTLHSAGHQLLDSLRSALAHPPFQRNLSLGPAHALFRSPSFMNVSGPPIVKAYRAFAATATDRAANRLVVLHDELELPLGRVKMRVAGSARGHNGLKSVTDALGGRDDFVRIGVGIGRPEGRGSDEVSRYVLRKMTVVEMRAVREAAVEVERLLGQL